MFEFCRKSFGFLVDWFIKMRLFLFLVNTTKIVEKIDLETFRSLIERCECRIGAHALDHLSRAQRNIFKADELLRPLISEKPAGIGLQKNGRYAVFYRRNKGYLKLIIGVDIPVLEIITFINVDGLPNLERLEND